MVIIKFEQFLIYQIYQIKNLKNGKTYIGQTKNSLKTRWISHRCQKDKLLGQEIQQFGEDNFEVSLLEICLSIEQANLAETKWITYFNTTDPNIGYNIEEGGTHKNQTAEARIKLSDIKKQQIADNPELLKQGLWSKESQLKSQQALVQLAIDKPEIIQAVIKAGHTPEANAKRGAAKKKYFEKHPDELKQQIEKAHTPEANKKRKETLTNLKETNPEAYAKMVNACRSPEANEKRRLTRLKKKLEKEKQ